MGTISGPFSIPDGLIYHIDPANPKSYAGYGTIIYDMSGNGNTSYFTNGAYYQNYQKGTVLVDGNNDFISTPLFNLTSPVTVSVWVKNVISDAIIFGASGTGVNYGNAEYIFGINGKSVWIQGNPGNYKVFQLPGLNLNEWSNLVMTRDAGNNMSVYLNGIGSTSNSQSYSNTLQMNQIGRYSAFSNAYNTKGSIGEAKIYNRALPASEVLQNYNATKGKYINTENYVTSNLVLNLDAGNPLSYPGTGNTIYDLSGFGHTATLVNGAVYSTLFGGNFYCDGTNDYIEALTTSALDFSNNSFTVEYWYRKTEFTSNFDNIFGPNIWSAGNNSNTNEWTLGIGQGAVQTPGIGESGGFYIQTTSFGIYGTGENRLVGSLNKFNQIVGIRNGNLMQLYFNGSLLYSATPGGGFDSLMTMNNVNNNIRIANSYANSYYSKVHSGILRIYNKALSATEVNQNYQATLPRFTETAIVTEGLILNYDFGSAETYPANGTLAQNLVGTGYTGTLNNGPSYSGLGGGSLVLDGTNDYISSSDFGLALPFTMSVWVYFNSLSGWQTIIGQDTSISVPRGRFYFQRANANAVSPNIPGRINFTLTKSDGEVWAVNSQANPTTSIWINYTASISATNMSLYQNGVLQDSLNGTFSLQAGTGPVTYGVGWYDSILADYCNLNLGLVHIYNKALTASEVGQNFNAMRNRYGI
jgi:hypothetical protein